MAIGRIVPDLAYIAAVEATPRVTPNFWCSAEWFHKAGWQVVYWDNGVMIPTDGDGVVMLPPVYHDGGLAPVPDGIDYIWAGFVDQAPPGPCWTGELLDHQYLVNPQGFTLMIGGEWATFRKNSRKWPKTHPTATYLRGVQDTTQSRIEVLEAWLESVDPDAEVFDSEVMTEYLLNGSHSEELWQGGQLKAVNIWDTGPGNWLVYRYCIARPEPFLSDYARLLFYLGHRVGRAGEDYRVNDGGDLGRPGLAEYKRRMNPYHIGVVNTWKRNSKEAQ